MGPCRDGVVGVDVKVPERRGMGMDMGTVYWMLYPVYGEKPCVLYSAKVWDWKSVSKVRGTRVSSHDPESRLHTSPSEESGSKDEYGKGADLSWTKRRPFGRRWDIADRPWVKSGDYA